MFPIKHISFDVWNTLVFPNRKYVDVRTQLLCKVYGVEPEIVQHVYKKTKDYLDDPRNTEDGAWDTSYAFKQQHALFQDFTKTQIVDLIALREEFEHLFGLNPPSVNPDNVISLMSVIQKDHDICYSILSNTNFISGQILKPFIEIAYESCIFEFMLFSDITGYAKPHRTAYNLLLSKSCEPKQHVVHIGDSYLCDVDGASLAGIRSRLIANSEDLHDTLFCLNYSGE